MNIKFKRTEIEIFYNNVKVFNVRFYQFIASSLNKYVYFFQKISYDRSYIKHL